MGIIIFVIMACLIGGALVAFGGLLMVGVLLTVRKGLRSRSWAVAVGKVIQSTSDAEDESPSESEDSDKMQELLYEFEVGEHKFTASHVQLRGSARSTITDRIEDELASRYRSGESVLVYYNPCEPKDAALQPGVPRGLFPLAALGSGFTVSGLAFILLSTGLLTFPQTPSSVAIVFMIPGAVCVLWGVWQCWTISASRFWPTVEARVVHSEVTRTYSKYHTASHHPRIAYQYRIDDATYVSSQLDWGRFGTTEAEAQRVADSYPVGRVIQVYYDPSRPHRSVIERRGWGIAIFLLLLGLGFTALGLLVRNGLR